MKKHNVINWQICYLSVVRDGSFIGEDISLFDMIILILNKGVQRTVNSVILAGLYLYRHGGQAVVIINKIVNLTLTAVIVIEQLIAVSN